MNEKYSILGSCHELKLSKLSRILLYFFGHLRHFKVLDWFAKFLCQKLIVVRGCNVIKYGCINYSQDTNWKIQASKDSLDQNHSHSCEDQTKCLLNPCLILA